MFLLAGLVTSLTGRLLWWVTIPALFLATVTFAKIAWDKRDARIMKQGEMVCTAKWEARIRDEERQQAAATVKRVEDDLENERKVTGDLRDELQVMAEAKAKLEQRASADPRCLSDGVLDAVRGKGGAVGKTARSK